MKEVHCSRLEHWKEACEEVESCREKPIKSRDFESSKDENCHHLLIFKTSERETECGSCLGAVTEMTGM